MDGGNYMHENAETVELVDIRTVVVDKTLSKQERIAEFIRQIKNPHQFKCGKFIITTRFSECGPTLEECLEQIVA